MSEHNEHHTEHESTEEEHGGHEHKPAGGLGLKALALGFFLAAVGGWLAWPNVVMSSKAQPINFSHVAHGEGAGLSCDSCHTFREDGSFSGIPKLEKCEECHASQQGSDPEEAKLIAQYIQPKKEIPWISYAFQPGCVFFSHAAHVKMAKLACTQCHEDMSKSKSSPPARILLLSGYSERTMSMETCEECHVKKHRSNACFVCHK